MSSSRKSLTIIFSLGLCSIYTGYQTYAHYKTSTSHPKRVYVDMVADLFHYGHANFLRQAKECGDYLIVGVCSDEDTASYKRKPIMSLAERVKLVESCKYVDQVIAGCPLKLTKKFIKEHQIDLVLHGDDWPAQRLAEFYYVPMEMGIFKTIPYTRTVSTTIILQRVHDYFTLDDHKKEAICA